MKKSKLVIGISSRALFDLDESHKIFERDGVDAYREYQILNEEKILNPGNAFGLVKKILEINNLYKSCLLYTSPSPRDRVRSRMPSSA